MVSTTTQIWIAKWVLFKLFIYVRRTECKLQMHAIITCEGGGEYLKIIMSITPGYIFTVNKVYIYEVIINTQKKNKFSFMLKV